jgi:hypothetical protein
VATSVRTEVSAKGITEVDGFSTLRLNIISLLAGVATTPPVPSVKPIAGETNS